MVIEVEGALEIGCPFSLEDPIGRLLFFNPSCFYSLNNGKMYGNVCLFSHFPQIGGIGVVGIVEKEPFSVLGNRIADEVPEWILPLWHEVNHDYIEISNLAIRHLVPSASECFVKESMRS
ncbi:hypothetical protein [Paenibacillus favisporus]|uniref:hypothetical protein n=1 Tax=Paenibacillus favisporus TaxID=221028 RepID=UPI001981C9DD|nr:hypothetical protein [Paenibacillus favisporus]